MLAAARAHLASRGQPDTLTAHFEYPSRTAAGPAVVVVEPVKLGRQLSTLHLTLWQGRLADHAPWYTPGASRRAVLAYATHANLSAWRGLSLPAGYQARPEAALPRLPDWEALAASGSDPAWRVARLPDTAVARGSPSSWRMCLPRRGPLSPGALDLWIATASGDPITQAALPYVVDSFPYELLAFLVAADDGDDGDDDDDDDDDDDKAPRAAGAASARAILGGGRDDMWLPTVVMNLETKKLLPREGVAWLCVRVTSKQIRDGRLDLSVVVRDLHGDIVALAGQVAMMLSMERNTGKTDKAAL
ncbi:hypothetical protein UVI_02012200 [Ustilaginoidea virens]|nr:hypothetical protein UVI_02012200 [Ustilaginoidea virens]